MKILVLAPQPFFIPRGTPIAVRALLQSLSDLGHSCDAIVYPEGEDIAIANVALYRVPRVPGTANMPPGFSLKKVIADMAMVPMVARRLWQDKYDLVIAVEESAFIALAMKPFFRVPYIYDVDSSIPEQMNDKFNLPRWIMTPLEAAEARAARGAIAAITCCKALQELVQGYAPGLPVQTLEDVTLVDEDTPATPPQDCRFDDPVLMYIGNLESYQGIDLLIEGFARAVGNGTVGHLVIIGGTPEHVAQYRDMAAKLGMADRVSLLGPRPVAQIGQYMAQATIVSSPRTQGRNTPMKVYSYLDSGRPLLATRLPTHTQVLDDEISMLVDPTPEDMARGIRALLSDAGLRERLAAAARIRVQHEFSPEAYHRKLKAFMETRVVPLITGAGRPEKGRQAR